MCTPLCDWDSSQLGWQPAEELRLYGGCDYYDRGEKYANLVGVYGGIAIDLNGLIFE